MSGKKSLDGVFKCVIMGAPGAGKGTISGRIVKHFPVTHMACGDYLRTHIRNKTDFGSEAQSYINRGALVPDHLVSKLMGFELQHHGGENWLLDGFPRTLPQAEFLQVLDPVQAVIDLHVPFKVIIERLKMRWIHGPSGRIYNLDFNPPKIPGKDDVTGENLTQRDDDKEETVLKRLNTYKAWEEPLADFYRELGILVRFTGKTSDEIWPQVYDFLKDKLPPTQPLITPDLSETQPQTPEMLRQ